MLRERLAGPDADGLWHWSLVDDGFVNADVRWDVAAAVVRAVSAAGVAMPSVAWFAGESVAERAYADGYDGDRPWDEFCSAGDLALFVDPLRHAVLLNRDLDRESMIAAASVAVECLAGGGR